ncbi:MAG TPA: serine--tRNA ligase [Candidatus Saccharimonadales bacterium]|nr:serine--tRNA ligase [Candidatus Saccharimonadales bacterium]
MLDIRFIRENPNLVEEKSAQKGYKVDIKHLLDIDEKRRELLAEIESIRARRNDLATRTKGGKPTEQEIIEGKALRDKLSQLEREMDPLQLDFDSHLKAVPNMPADDVPVGGSEADNVVSKEWGEKPQFDFEPKTHWEIAESRNLIDKQRAAKVAGSRFAYIFGDLVKLQFALIQFALDILTNEETLKKIIQDFELENVSPKPFMPTLPPAMAKTSVYEATGRLNKEEQTYKLEDDDLWLNASAEHTLAPMFMGEVLNANDLPGRYVGYTTAFRREAGTYGKDTEGILRLHQFDKLEMESFSLPEDGMNEHLFMIAIQEYFMRQLGIPYHVLNKCTADIGFPNARGVDIEAWMPGQNTYRETHTADFISDFQAEGTKTRVKTDNGTVFVHNNDATVFAAGRTLIAIIENYQTKDGKIDIPKVLQPYMRGQTSI